MASFTTYWLKFKTGEEALSYFISCPYPCRVSPQSDLSIDIKYFDRVLYMSEFAPLHATHPMWFVLDDADPIPFLTFEERHRLLVPTSLAA